MPETQIEKINDTTANIVETTVVKIEVSIDDVEREIATLDEAIANNEAQILFIQQEKEKKVALRDRLLAAGLVKKEEVEEEVKDKE